MDSPYCSVVTPESLAKGSCHTTPDHHTDHDGADDTKQDEEEY